MLIGFKMSRRSTTFGSQKVRPGGLRLLVDAVVIAIALGLGMGMAVGMVVLVSIYFLGVAT